MFSTAVTIAIGLALLAALRGTLASHSFYGLFAMPAKSTPVMMLAIGAGDGAIAALSSGQAAQGAVIGALSGFAVATGLVTQYLHGAHVDGSSDSGSDTGSTGGNTGTNSAAPPIAPAPPPPQMQRAATFFGAVAGAWCLILLLGACASAATGGAFGGELTKCIVTARTVGDSGPEHMASYRECEARVDQAYGYDAGAQ